MRESGMPMTNANSIS